MPRPRPYAAALLTAALLSLPTLPAHADPTPTPSPAPGQVAPDTLDAASAALSDSQDQLDRAAAAAAATRMKLHAARAQLRKAHAAVRRNRDALHAARAAAAAALVEQTRATVALTTVGYRAQSAQVSLDSLVRSSYANAASVLPSWTVLVAGAPDALRDETALAKAESNAATYTATTVRTLAHATAHATDLAARAAAAQAAREDAEAQVAARLAASVRLGTRIEAVTGQLARLEQVQDQRLAEAQKLVAADTARMVALTRAAHVLTAQLDRDVSQLPARLRKILTSAAGGFWYPGTGVITSPFGMRFHPILHYVKLHTGTDFSVGDGYAYAAADGVVLSADYNTAYGNLTVIGHGTLDGKTVETWYAHQSEQYVHVGDVVHRGQVIGHIGDTGYATGPHLHFEIRVDGEPLDPMGFLTPTTPRPSGGRPNARTP